MALVSFRPGTPTTLTGYFNNKFGNNSGNTLSVNDLGTGLLTNLEELERQRSTVQSMSPRIYKVLLRLPLTLSEKVKIFQITSRILFNAALGDAPVKAQEGGMDKLINQLFESYERELNREDSRKMLLLEQQLTLAYQTLELISKERRTLELAKTIIDCFTEINDQDTLESLFKLFKRLSGDCIEHFLSNMSKLTQKPQGSINEEDLDSRRDSLIRSLISLLNNDEATLDSDSDPEQKISRLIDTGVVLSLLPIDEINSQSAGNIHQLFEYMKEGERKKIIECLSDEKWWGKDLSQQLKVAPWIHEIFTQANIFDSEQWMACFLILNALDLRQWDEDPLRTFIHCYSKLRKDQLLNLLKTTLRSI